MTVDATDCIYCSASFDPNKGEGDHVLPRGFGDFENAIIFRGMCPACNNKLSTLEEELLRTGPEAVYRRFAGAAKNRRGEPVGWQGASGLPPPRFVIIHGDHMELIEADPTVGGDSRPVDHLHIVIKDGRTFDIKLFSTMTADALRRRLNQLGIGDQDIDRSYWHSDDKHTETYRAILREVWPKCRQVELPDTPAGVHRVPIRIECRITEKYYRAIAKIAFHYLLSQTKCGFTGRETYFAPIRQFLQTGGDKDKFFDVLKPDIRMPVGVQPDGTALLPSRWMHLLCGFESATSAVVAVYTLFGPQRPPSPHFVTLFQRSSLCVVPEHRYGHGYVHGNAELGDTREASVEPFDIDQIGWSAGRRSRA